MKTKIIVLVSVLLVLVSCKSNEKEANKLETSEPLIEKTEKASKFNFPVAEDILSNPHLMNLTYDGHAFEEDIVFSELNVLKTAEDTYTFIFTVDHDLTNFDKLLKWKVAMMFFAKNPNDFASEIEQKKGFKTTALLAKPYVIGDEVVLIHKDFKIKPKNFKLLRMYLYVNNNEMNKNYYNINNIVLP